MTDTDHIDQLEARIAVLEGRDLRRESEHRNLLMSYEDMTKSRETLRREVEEDYTLFGKAMDKRIAEIASRAGGDGEMDEDFCGIYRGMLWLLQQQQALCDRLCWLEDGRLRDLQRLDKLLSAFSGPQAA